MVSKIALDSYAPTQDRQFKDRHLIVGASEIGMCMRRIGYMKKSKDPRYIVETDPDYNDSYGARTRGSIFEEFWDRAMRHQYGDKFIFSGKRQRSWKSGLLSGTPDGIMVDQKRDALIHLGIKDIKSDCFVVDCKSIDPRINLNDAKPEHKLQVNTQLGLLNEVSNYKPQYGVLAYHNASFWDDVVEFVIEYNHAVYARSKERAKKILESQSAAELLPEGWIAGGDECRYCPFSRACYSVRGDVPKESVRMPDLSTMKKLTGLALAHEKLASIASATQEEQRKIQHTIKELLRANNLRRVADSAIRIVWSPVKGRPSYDMPKFKEAAEAAGVDFRLYETVGQPTDRLVITILSDQSKVQSAESKSEYINTSKERDIPHE